MLKTMKIFTQRLELTNFKAEYAEEFTKVLSDPKIFIYLPESVPTINDVENLIQWFIERDLKNAKNGFKGTNLAIFHKENKKIIGWCGLQPFEPIPDKKEIFFGLSPSYWNKGYMSEAAEVVLNYGFCTLDLEEIVAGVKPNNIASIAVLEKTGLTYQKILKEVPKGCEFYLGERFYSITKDQYSMKKV
jgi:ribosomal-protein-alanine N-acetyltransferase